MKYTGTIASEYSGSLGGITASRNKGGSYFRQKVIPTNPNTTLQSLVRTILQEVSDRWANILTPAQRVAWTAWAENTPGFTGAGIDAYQYINLPRQYAIEATLSFAPTDPFLDDVPASFDVGSFSPITAVYSAATNRYTVTFDNTDDWAIGPEGALLIYTGFPLNPSRSNYFGRYNLLDAIPGNGTPPTSPLATAVAPFAAVVGQRLFMKARAISQDGRVSMSQRVTMLVTA